MSKLSDEDIRRISRTVRRDERLPRNLPTPPQRRWPKAAPVQGLHYARAVGLIPGRDPDLVSGKGRAMILRRRDGHTPEEIREVDVYCDFSTPIASGLTIYLAMVDGAWAVMAADCY